jgi:hypothetical protein
VIVSWHWLALDEAITERHSTRMFLPQSVPRALVDEFLALAQHAPSNSNIQPWHMVFASGPPRNRLVAALLDAIRRGPPNIPPLPESFQHYRRELGAQVYGAMGICAEDTAMHAAAVLRNWEFFRAPLRHCLHAQGPRPSECPERGDVFANVAAGLHRTGSRNVRRSLGHGVSSNRSGAAGYSGGTVDAVRPRLVREQQTKKRARSQPQISSEREHHIGPRQHFAEYR